MQLRPTSTFLISLPQSAIRLWGIDAKYLGDVKLVEIPQRTNQDCLLNDANRQVNELVLSELGARKSEVVEKDQLDEKMVSNSILDCNILNLVHHYPKLDTIREVSILDYSSLGHRTLLRSDFLSLRETARALRRNFQFKNKFSPSYILHWDDYALARKESIINFGWSNDFVNTSRIEEKSKDFMANNLFEIPEIKDVSLDSRILLISPHIKSTQAEVKSDVISLVNSNKEAMAAFANSDYILIKQHRTSDVIISHELKILGKVCRTLQSPISRAIPIEIYIHGFANSTIFSTPSSAIYSHGCKSFLLRSQINESDIAEYGLMSHRHQRISMHS
jgi:hypothetical protein